MRRDNHMDTTRPGQPTGNRTLDALPTEVRQRILAQLTPVNLPIKTVLFEPGETVHHVHFPVTGVVSLVTPLEPPCRCRPPSSRAPA